MGFAFFLMGIGGYAAFRLNRLVRRKGYRSPFPVITIISGYFAAFGTGFYLTSPSPDICWSCSPAENPERFRPHLLWTLVRHFAAYFSVGSILAMMALGRS